MTGPSTEGVDVVAEGAHTGGDRRRVHLEVRNLRTYVNTQWGAVKAVDDLSLSIYEMETFGLVGESGCGKTMFCHSLLKLLPKATSLSGQILLEGEDLVPKTESDMRKIRGSRISMALQDPMTCLDPVFTIGTQLTETVSLQGGYGGLRVRERAGELLRMVRIPAPETRLKAYPHQFSGGMRQRVAGAIALARQPRLLIADEPTSALDVITQANYLALLKEVQQKVGLTVLFVTHDFGVVGRICDRVGVIYAGRLVEVGGVKAVFEQPLHPYTQALLKSVPRLDKKVDRLASIAGQPPVLHNLPPGCVFSPRCSSSIEKCTIEYPPTTPAGNGRSVACWLHA